MWYRASHLTGAMSKKGGTALATAAQEAAVTHLAQSVHSTTPFEQSLKGVLAQGAGVVRKWVGSSLAGNVPPPPATMQQEHKGFWSSVGNFFKSMAPTMLTAAARMLPELLAV